MSAPAVEESPGHQRVGWLELFYDLVFVVVIEQITHRLHGDPSAPTLLGTAGLVVLVWTLWFNVTALSNISHGIVRWARIPVLASMAGVGVVALGIGELGHGTPWLFLAGWAIARTAVWPVWAVGRRRRGMGPWRPFLFGPGLGILWLGTGFVPEPWRYAAWFALSAAEWVLASRPDDPDSYQFDGAHMVERIGLFVMIILGESVVQIIQALEASMSPVGWVAAGLSFALLCALWWLVYEATVARLEEQVGVASGWAVALQFVGGAQLLVVVGLVGVAGGLAGAIEHAGTTSAGSAHLTPGGVAALCGGLLLVFLGVAILSRRTWEVAIGPIEVSWLGPWLRVLGIVAPTLVVWYFAPRWPPGVGVGVVFLLCLAMVGRQVAGNRMIEKCIAQGRDVSELGGRRRRGKL